MRLHHLPWGKATMRQHGNVQPVKASLKVKTITYISLLILVVGAMLGWHFLNQTRGVLTEELQKRALSLTKNLAHNSKYGIVTEDAVILRALIEGILQEDDVLCVLISDAQGKVLAQAAKGRGDTASVPSSVALALQHARALAPHITAPSLHTHVIGDRGIYHTATPVETTEAVSSQREQQLARALVLLGKEGNPEASAAAPPVRHGSVQLILSLETMQANIRTTFVTGIGLTGGIILIGVLVSFVFCGHTLTPIQAMAQAASHIAAGDLAQRVEVPSRDEIGVLAMTFNRMTESLAQMTQAQQQRLAELSALHAIGVVISATLDVDRLIELTLDAVREHLGYDRARLFLVDTGKQALVQGRIAGAPEALRAQVRALEIPLRDDAGFHARVALSGEPVLVEELAQVQAQAYRPMADLLESRSLVVVPLKVEHRMLGVLSVDNSQTDRPLTRADQHVLTTLANQVAIAIANALAYQQVEQLNVRLEERVQERTDALQRQQERLQEVNLQLELANRHKSEFLANMSHELRTPLNAIIGFSEVLLEQMFGTLNAKQAEYLNDVLSSGHYLLSLINDILDLAKVEAGRLELELSVIDLRHLLEGSLVMVRERALAHGITLALEITDDVPAVVGDERKVKQICFNLLSNAVKFTPDGGQVGITARQAGDVVQVAVWDTGVGIAPADQPRIFEEFQQVGQGLTGKTEGTGLGLTLTKRFVELHGGTIWVDSTPGQGSTFTFTLPLTWAADQTSRPVGQEAPVWERGTAPPTPGPLVLVVEDDPKAADLLRIYLIEAGYTVDLARDGAEGLEKVKQLAPAAVLLDVLLPKVDGWAFLQQVKADPATTDIPVVIVSIVDQKGKGFALGAAEYLVKPVHKEALLHTLQTFGLGTQGRTTPVTVLVIDDDPHAVELLVATLEPEGFRVLTAASGEAGLRVAETARPDLIILDLLMPGMNGFEVLDGLEQSPTTQMLPVILFTVKQLTAEEKQRVRGRIARLAQKGTFHRKDFAGMVRDALQRTLREDT